MRRVQAFVVGLVSLHGSARGISGGFALGLGLSLIPIPFAGMLVALALAPLLRLNPASTYLGTAIINPLTGPFFYFLELWLGMTLVGRAPPSWATLRSLDASGWLALIKDLVGPFAVGAAVAIPCAALLSYALIYAAVRRWRAKAT